MKERAGPRKLSTAKTPAPAPGSALRTHCGSAADFAAHDSGTLTNWSVSDWTLTMSGMKIIDGLETATVSAPIGPNGTISSMTFTITAAVVPIIPVGASMTLPAAGVVAP
jgi:hypothetical protein